MKYWIYNIFMGMLIVSMLLIFILLICQFIYFLTNGDKILKECENQPDNHPIKIWNIRTTCGALRIANNTILFKERIS